MLIRVLSTETSLRISFSGPDWMLRDLEIHPEQSILVKANLDRQPIRSISNLFDLSRAPKIHLAKRTEASDEKVPERIRRFRSSRKSSSATPYHADSRLIAQ